MGLDLVEFFDELEQLFELPIPHIDATRLKTPGMVVDYLCGRLSETPGSPNAQWTRDQVTNAVYELLDKVIDFDARAVGLDADLIHDLGMG